MEKHLLDYISTIGSVSTPLLLIGLAAIGWRVRHRYERIAELEEKLRLERMKLYDKILEPFVVLLMSDAAWVSDPKNKGKDKTKMATDKMLSLDYRDAVFKMVLMANDDVVRAYNALMQHFYSAQDGDVDLRKIVKLLGGFLLAIRKSMGNELTSLNEVAMLEWLINDIQKYK